MNRIQMFLRGRRIRNDSISHLSNLSGGLGADATCDGLGEEHAAFRFEYNSFEMPGFLS